MQALEADIAAKEEADIAAKEEAERASSHADSQTHVQADIDLLSTKAADDATYVLAHCCVNVKLRMSVIGNIGRHSISGRCEVIYTS
jgi:hypothetical protein